MRKKNNVKHVVLPHSQAKLDLYKKYLEHYLIVIGMSPYFDNINLYDIYCGSGKYSDGKIGSPVITNQVIAEINTELIARNKPLKKITLNINDFEKSKIDNVKKLLLDNPNTNCIYYFYNKDAIEILEIVKKEVNKESKNERNLIFIDPYGYSSITKEMIFDLIKNDKTEVILFLPVMQIYRFADFAVEDDSQKACYENLRKFIYSFFPSPKAHDIEIGNNIFDFIKSIQKAFSYNNKYYSCSHYIERNKGNYYALFFITANIYGLEKMVETKWNLDPNNGEGFKQKHNEFSLFKDEFAVEDRTMNIEILKEEITSYLIQKKQINNWQLYELALINEFKPIHAKQAIVDLLKANKIAEINNTKILVDNINYKHFKDKIVKCTFILT